VFYLTRMVSDTEIYFNHCFLRNTDPVSQISKYEESCMLPLDCR